MNWFNSLLIRSRLLVLLVLMSAVMAGLGLYGGLQLSTEAARSEATLKTHLTAVRVLGEVRAGVANARRYEKDQFLNLGNEERTEHYRKLWAAEVDALVQRLDATSVDLPEGQQATITMLRQGIGNYRRGLTELNRRIDRGELNDPWAANAAMESLKGDVRAADTALGELVRSVENNAQSAETQLAERTRHAHLMMGAATLAAILVGVWLTLVISRSITKPLRALQATAARWAEGDLGVEAQGGGRDELADVQRGLNVMRQSLVLLLIRVRSSAESIATASSEINAGNRDLSNRTEQAASSLQQTAASMVQLTGTVQQTADSARIANDLAASASSSAAKGGQVVGQVVSTMDEIDAASARIAEITGVIDSIAFQTNILALNAAVEAARAGEQGRGFAVVAGEVRALARRCAEAAMEIKGLIHASTTKVGAGAQLVREAGSTMNEIVAEVRHVNDILGRISAGSAEQSEGIGQVNVAVSRLDHMTQQNAALVEQSATAVESLRHQALALQDAVALFRFGEHQLGVSLPVSDVSR